MSRKSQQSREKVHLIAFKEGFEGFPKGEIINDERPDFLIKNEKNVIGIELTELFHKPRKDGTILQARENHIFEILNAARELYNSINFATVNVHVNFSIHAKLRKRKAKRLSVKLVDIVKKNIPSEDIATKTILRASSCNILPPELSMVKIVRLDGIEKSNFYPTGIGGAIPKIPAEYIEEGIRSKNEKVEEYRYRCDKIWLLLVVDGFLPSSWFEVDGSALEKTYDSNFDKTYILDFQRKRSFLLKNT